MKLPKKRWGRVLCLLILAATAANAEPNIRPALNPDVTQETIARTICVPGWTKTVRAGSWHARRLKLRFLDVIGRTPEDRRSYQLDHVVPLTLGGELDDAQRAIGVDSKRPRCNLVVVFGKQCVKVDHGYLRAFCF